MREQPREHLVALMVLTVAMLLWASSFIALKFAFASYSPMFVIWARMIIACGCFVFFIKQFMRFDYKAGDWKLLSVMCLLEPCLYFILEAEALLNTSASQAGTITALLPLFIAVAAYFIVGERVTQRQMLGFVIAFIGVLGLTIFSEVNESAPNPMWGNFLEFGAMFCAALYSVLLKRFSVRYSAIFLTAFPAMVGAVFFLPFQFFIELPQEVNWQGISAIIYLGTCVTLGAYLCYNYAISRLPVILAGSFGNLIPVFTVALAWLILDEQLTFLQLIACGIVALGVVISQTSNKKTINC
ncbi:MAG: DMT family transporter [Gammaproteobacteria bacterium]|nr:DMT family transporter [Gammaproteobacteria bacterium]